MHILIKGPFLKVRLRTKVKVRFWTNCVCPKKPIWSRITFQLDHENLPPCCGENWSAKRKLVQNLTVKMAKVGPEPNLTAYMFLWWTGERQIAGYDAERWQAHVSFHVQVAQDQSRWHLAVTVEVLLASALLQELRILWHSLSLFNGRGFSQGKFHQLIISLALQLISQCGLQDSGILRVRRPLREYALTLWRGCSKCISDRRKAGVCSEPMEGLSSSYHCPAFHFRSNPSWTKASSLIEQQRRGSSECHHIKLGFTTGSYVK